MSGTWREEDVLGLRVLRCDALDAIRGVAHAFSSRAADGGSGFDLGSARDTGPEIGARRRRFLDAAGLRTAEAFILHQVHGHSIVDASQPTLAPPEADGAFLEGAEHGGVALTVRSADCVPILMTDRGGRVLAAVHAGWRGIAAGVATVAVERFVSHGARAGDLVAALGPSIGRCCYEVGPEVVSALRPAAHAMTPSLAGRAHIDLKAVIGDELVLRGVLPEHIHAAPWCTRCRADLFFSYRRQGDAAGRLMAVIGRLDAS